MKQQLRILTAIVILLTLISCSSSNTGNVVYETTQNTQVLVNNVQPEDHPVNITKFRFTPTHIVINKGDRITFTNVGADDIKIFESSFAKFESPYLEPKQFYTHTFTRKGIYNYEVERNRIRENSRHNEPRAHGIIEVM